MSGDAAMLAMIAGMHLLGLLCAAALLVPALRGPQVPPPQDGGSGGGGGRRPEEPPAPSRPRGGVPLPDAIPARVRLRDHRRLTERLPRHERRPAREPARTPERVSGHQRSAVHGSPAHPH
jgi:hypothetical protein